MSDRARTHPLAGVVGWPVAQSRSPRLHRHWMARHGLPGDYVALEVAPEDLAEVVRMLPRAGFVGVNVTVPHKRAALALADEASERARRVGAANTLTFRDGRILADTTDGEGFLRALREGAPDWRPEAGPAVLLGAGGAARAVLDALLEAGVPELHLLNRTAAAAEALAAELGRGRVRVRPWIEAGNAVEDGLLVVNATALGMEGAPPLRVPLDGLHAGQVVTDLVYAPLETRLLREARAAGAVAVDGLGMLLHQAAGAFEAWWRVRPEVDEDLRRAVLG
ncbi:shikimate dehydrogenase [Rubellimicrobium sp. CFH 75288]|uniref:shikimate dehydrogenase n=1 Tax=Rubellimicrobium sp. CFH 75288 TaxID=2697034 RepID=UPI00141365E2|nr:shikimate dehydrogenase [Rubellimicrobium sp. CFH 75288]NAZ37773.1 shikimate dehydrogenase [Rubellimicrobium sp. CFH 75288]